MDQHLRSNRVTEMNRFVLFAFTGLLAFANVSIAQPPGPTAEHEVLKKDVGTWKASMKMWMGADGKTDPTAEPQVFEGTEVNRMLGDFWVLSTFKVDLGGMEFEGHATAGYDSIKKQYVGTWTDSMSPFAMQMVGTFDPETDTMTMTSKGIGMDGKEALGKMTVKYQKDGSRLMKMYEIADGKELKSMEVLYTKGND